MPILSVLARKRALSATTALALASAGGVVLGSAPAHADGATSLTTLGAAYTENFNTLVSTGTGTLAANTPPGWQFLETGTGANTTYTAGTGTGTAGDTYSFGATGSTDRAFGSLQSGATIPTIGAQLTNSTGGTITSLDVSFTTEQWRLGTSGRQDRLDAQVSTDATSLNTGTWSDVNSLDALGPVSTGTVGPLDGNAAANRAAVSGSISGLSVANGSTVWIRWASSDASGADDGIAIDDVSITPQGTPGGTPTNPSGTGAATPASVVPGGSSVLTVTTTPGTNPDSTGLTVSADLTAIGGSATQALADDGVAPDATAGDGIFTASATVDPGTTTGAKTLPFTVTDAQARTGTGSIALTITPLVPCAAADQSIGSVQTSGPAGITGTVTVEGTVVGDYEGASPALRGFYLQDSGDGDDTTSDGIFVFEGDNANRVAVGDVVQVTGGAGENQGQTQISSTTGIVSCATTASVTPTEIVLPMSAPDFYERYEGMLVTYTQPLYLTEHFQLGRFGQVTLSGSDRLRQPTNVVAPGAPALALQAQNNLDRIILDDGTQAQNPDPITFGRGGNPLSATNTARGGDTITGLHGVMTFTWGGNAASPNAYRIRAVGSLGGGTPDLRPTNPRPTTAPAVGGTLKVVGMNLLNYFNTFGTGACAGGVGGAATDCRGADNATEFDRQNAKTVAAILKMDADVIGVNEIENDGYGPTSALADLVDRLNAATAPGTYAYLDADARSGQVNALGNDAIKVGMLYKPATVDLTGTTGILNSAAFVEGGDGAPRNRATFAQAIVEKATGGRFVLGVNHLKSKGSACTAPDAGDGQGNCNQVRLNAVNALTAWLASDPTGTGETDVLLVGDYNSYAMEDPIMALEAAGFTHLIKSRLGADAYSYVFDGQWGYLDHALASGSLDAQVSGVGDYHINADEPSVLDYTTNFKTPGQIISLYAPDEFRVSDHDPVIVGLTLDAPATVADGQSVTTAEDTSTPVTLTGTSPRGATITYAVVTGPAHGTLSGTAPNLTYTPDANYHGPDSFTFTADDGTSVSASATVSITVTPVNDAPTAGDFAVTTSEGNPAPVTLLGNDVDGDTLTWTIEAGPSHGTLTGTAPNLTYTPAPGFSGTDTLVYSVSDGVTSSEPSTVTISVSPVNDAPSISVVTGGACLSNTSGRMNLSVTDPDSANVTVTASSSNPAFIPNANVEIAGTGATRTITVTAANSRGGSAVITLTASDGSATSTTTISVQVGTKTGNILTGGAGSDLLIGAAGNDTLTGDEGIDLLCGMGGVDNLSGGLRDDTLDGGAGNDSIDGGDGNDALIGGAGNDAMTGGTGNDTLLGVGGRDTMTGGTGADFFDGGRDIDTVTDFNPLEGDFKINTP